MYLRISYQWLNLIHSSCVFAFEWRAVTSRKELPLRGLSDLCVEEGLSSLPLFSFVFLQLDTVNEVSRAIMWMHLLYKSILRKVFCPLISFMKSEKLVWLFVEVKWMRWPVLFCLCPVGLTADRLVHVGTRTHIQPSSAGWKGRGTRMGWGWRPRSSVLFSEAPILNVFLGNSWGREKKLSVSGHICLSSMLGIWIFAGHNFA